MKENYRNKIFSSYNRIHTAYLDPDFQSKLDWFQGYTKKNYMKHIDKIDKNTSKILEIGCNRGYLLAALSFFGFKNLYGLDLSPDDVEKAKVLVPTANIVCSNAFYYLIDREKQFEVIILKAVLEHLKKEDIIPLLEKIKNGLKTDGIVIIDVPNMDWLFGLHERYMDYTHEVGFTKESLRQVMNITFSDVSVEPVDNIFYSSWIGNIKKILSRFILQNFFNWADPEGASNPIWSRSIIGVGKK